MLHGRVVHRLLAHDFCLDQGRGAVEGCQCVVFFGIGAGEPRFRRRDLGLLGLGLAGKTIDHRFLRFDAGLGGINRQLVVAVIKLENDIAGLDRGIFRRRNFRDIARNLGAELRHVGFHIGVIGGNLEAAQHKPVVAIIDSPRQGRQNDRPHNGAPHDGRALGLGFDGRCSGLGRLGRGGKGELWQGALGSFEGEGNGGLC